MIRSIRHKGLKRLYEDDDRRGIIGQHAERLRDILARLDASAVITDMDLPGFRLHPLKGELKGFWAVTVRANWRVISGLMRVMRWTLIMSITIERGERCR